MKSICVNYITHSHSTENNRELVKKVFMQLEQQNVKGVNYAAFQMGNNVFIHFAEFENLEAHETFESLSAFQELQKNISERLSSEPIITPLKEIVFFSSSNASRPYDSSKGNL
jgi:hypothetical protein